MVVPHTHKPYRCPHPKTAGAKKCRRCYLAGQKTKGSHRFWRKK